MIDNQKGSQITSAFQYIQQVFTECQNLIFKIDNKLAPDWATIYGNRITRDVSASLQEPNYWLPEAIFRVYGRTDDNFINKAITISFWGDVDQPVITVGEILYSDPAKKNHWDLWYLWFSEEYRIEGNKYELDGKVNIYTSETDRIKKAKIFSLPLIQIANEDALIEKIIEPLKSI